jgi:hypothetical protein
MISDGHGYFLINNYSLEDPGVQLPSSKLLEATSDISTAQLGEERLWRAWKQQP